MPFTVSHAVAALPFVRTPLPIAALVIGTMSPDLPYFLPLGVPRDLSHSLLGVVNIDLIVGIVVLAAWVLLLRAPLLDYAPGWLRERMPPRQRTNLLWMPVALVVGSLTHLALDLITHEGSLDHVLPVLAVELGPLTVANVVHIVFSLVGGVILAVWVRRWVTRTARHAASGIVSETERRLWWVGLIVAFVAMFSWIWGIQFEASSGLFSVSSLFIAFCIPVGVLGFVTLIVSAVWHIRARRARRQTERRTATTLPSTVA